VLKLIDAPRNGDSQRALDGAAELAALIKKTRRDFDKPTADFASHVCSDVPYACSTWARKCLENGRTWAMHLELPKFDGLHASFAKKRVYDVVSRELSQLVEMAKALLSRVLPCGWEVPVRVHMLAGGISEEGLYYLKSLEKFDEHIQ
jgi:hypothetical protein